ncbi:MAG: DUF3078 domain-containing protein [Bacteroidetes bacterium]|nr:DUF3078 domain-containing protein [Bacteroidota bacterium]
MRTFTLLLLFLALTGILFAQDIKTVASGLDKAKNEAPPDTAKHHWLISGFGSLTVNQAAFSNWAAGGTNSLGVSSMLSLRIRYSKNKHAWSNFLDLGYGFQYLGPIEHAKYNKTDDKIEYTTAYSYQIHPNKKWFLTVLANFRSQFSPGYNYPNDSVPISAFMAPGYVVVGPGITYRPANFFTLYVSPASGRFTFVLNDTLSKQGAFGVEKGKKMRAEMGPFVRTELNKDLAKNINITTSLELFTDYFHSFGCIDVNWNVLFTLKVNKWLATIINCQVIYDDDTMIQTNPPEPATGPRTQLKETIGVGLSYKFH